MRDNTFICQKFLLTSVEILVTFEWTFSQLSHYGRTWVEMNKNTRKIGAWLQPNSPSPWQWHNTGQHGDKMFFFYNWQLWQQWKQDDIRTIYIMGLLSQLSNPNVSFPLACFDSLRQESGWTAASGILGLAPPPPRVRCPRHLSSSRAPLQRGRSCIRVPQGQTCWFGWTKLINWIWPTIGSIAIKSIDQLHLSSSISNFLLKISTPRRRVITLPSFPSATESCSMLFLDSLEFTICNLGNRPHWNVFNV